MKALHGLFSDQSDSTYKKNYNSALGLVMSNGTAQNKLTSVPLALIFIGFMLEMKFIKLRFSEIICYYQL